MEICLVTATENLGSCMWVGRGKAARGSLHGTDRSMSNTHIPSCGGPTKKKTRFTVDYVEHIQLIHFCQSVCLGI